MISLPIRRSTILLSLAWREHPQETAIMIDSSRHMAAAVGKFECVHALKNEFLESVRLRLVVRELEEIQTVGVAAEKGYGSY